MPEHPPASDSTVRMDTGRPSGRPPATAEQRRPALSHPPVEVDDTRPVPRDWMRGADDTAAAAGDVGAGATAVLTADLGAADLGADDTMPGDIWDGARWDTDGGDAAEDTAAVDFADGDTAAVDFADGDTAAVDLPVGGIPVADAVGAGAPDGRAPNPPREAVSDGEGAGGPGGPGGDGPGDRGRGPRRPWWQRRLVLAPVAAVAVLGGAYGLDLLVSSGDIPRHTVVGGVDIGGLSPAAASSALQRQLAPRMAADRTVLAAEVRSTFSPKQAGLGLDVPATVAAAERQPLNPWTRLTTVFTHRTVRPVLGRDATDLTAELAALAATVDRAPVDATVALDGTTATVVQPSDGRRLDRPGSAAAITAALTRGGHGSIRLPVLVSHPHVTAAQAQKVLDGTVTPALSAPVTVVGQNGAARTDIPVSALAAALTFTPKDDGELAVGLDPAKLQAALGRTFAAFGTPARDATFRISGGSISVVPSVDGSGVDPAKLATQLMAVLTSPAPRSVTAELGPVPAAFTTAQATALGIKEQVGSFTTHFAATPSATNIRVVAAKVDGALVKPGETFSLNTFTGTRGTAQGYVPAGVIEGGKFTTAVGGGISQFATTMFNAEFFSGVQDIHHQPHSYWITRYPAGREATVFDGLIDLVWKNDSTTGIYVQTAWTPSSITVTFWGTKHYDIESVSGDRRNVVAPAVQEQPDDGTCKPQAGQQGFDITVTRVFKDLSTGAVLRTQDFHTHYKAEPVIHCVPAAAPGGTSPAPAPTGTGRRPAATVAASRRRRTVRPRR